MRITLQIENVDRLETGGQVSYSCADRGFDIGRHEHLDWSLPDPQRVISGKHCEVRFEGGNFVLYDVSTNGTFVNGSPNRMDKPHLLRSGDKLMVGDYIIGVALEAGDSPAFGAAPPQVAEPFAPPFASAQPNAAAPGWTPPQPAEPGYPAAQSVPTYPAQDLGSPWAAAPAGMEGRHAPPSDAPGVGTPADDVWSQQGHGWGSADPALYDPARQQPETAPARPFQADPLDHLAVQPDLLPSAAPAVADGSAAPFPPFGEPATGQGAPHFDMPELDVTSETVPEPAPAPAPAPASPPEAVADAFAEAGVPAESPFPDAAAWGTPPEPSADTAASVRTPEAPAAEPPRAEPLQQPAAATNEPATHASVVQQSPAPAPIAEQTAPPVSEVDTPGLAEPVNVAAGVDFVAAFAEGAGIPASALEGRDPEEFARELGAILQGITGDLMGLLQARSQVKAMTRNANRTLISRSGNNALKFSPTPQMALQTMLSKSAEDNGYLPIDKAMSSAFKDIQKHHVWTYAAMQKAAARFDATLSPTAIEQEGAAAKSTFGNQKAKLWERMQERWTSLSGAYDDGLVGVFTQYFTESYEQLNSEDPESSG